MFLGHILKLLNLFDTSQVGHNFPCNIISKLHVGWQDVIWTPNYQKKQKTKKKQKKTEFWKILFD